MSIPANETPDSPTVRNAGKRRVRLALIAATVAVAAAGAGARVALELSHSESTDDAYLQGNLVQFTPLVSVIVSGLEPQKIASATGLSNFVRITAGAFTRPARVSGSVDTGGAH